MLQTPASFIALTTPQAHPAPAVFLFRGTEILVRAADHALPDQALCAALDIDYKQLHPVGLFDGRYCCTSWLDRSMAAPDGYAFRNMRGLFGVLDEQWLSLAGRASQIAEWARTHQYCGACAAPMQTVDGERCYRCPACAMTAYPRISPAMMVLIRRGDTILLARNAMAPANRFSALAGFLEAGESVEEAVHREVFEEVGLQVTNLRYFGSQAWPFPHSLMVAFTADYRSGTITVDQQEIAEARWFGPGDALPELATGVSIAHALISAHLPPGASGRR